MDALLDKIQFANFQGAITCCDVLCNHNSDRISCATLCDQLISVCLKASDASLPQCAARHGQLPMWNDNIRPLRDDCLFWHWLWKEAGRPAAGAL